MYFKQSEKIASAELDSEICIFNPFEGSYVNLNNSASAIWKMLEKSINFEEIIENLMKIYDIDEEICKKEVKYFLAEAKKAQLIVELDGN